MLKRKTNCIIIISSLKNTNCTGCNDIPVPILKIAINYYLVNPLLHIVSSSFISGLFPEKLKVTKIKSLFKISEQLVASNQRPLELSSVISKIFENEMLNQLLNYIE